MVVVNKFCHGNNRKSCRALVCRHQYSSLDIFNSLCAVVCFFVFSFLITRLCTDRLTVLCSNIQACTKIRNCTKIIELSGFLALSGNDPIYTRDGSSVWDEFGQRTIVRLIIRLRINTGKQTDHPSRRTIWIIRVNRRITGANSSERIIRLFARIYTQTNYQTNYRSLPKFFPDEWSICSINRANVFI